MFLLILFTCFDFVAVWFVCCVISFEFLFCNFLVFDVFGLLLFLVWFWLFYCCFLFVWVLRTYLLVFYDYIGWCCVDVFGFEVCFLVLRLFYIWLLWGLKCGCCLTIVSYDFRWIVWCWFDFDCFLLWLFVV